MISIPNLTAMNRQSRLANQHNHINDTVVKLVQYNEWRK